MTSSLFASCCVYGLLSLGLGWPIAARLAVPATEKLLAGVALSLIGVFLSGWLVYTLALPVSILWILPALAAAGLIGRRSALLEAWREAPLRDLLNTQLIVTAWSVGWLSLVVNYSGGSWVGDWFGHWQRTQFFLEQGPPDILFNGFDPLTSRPPFANIVIGAFITLTVTDFAHYQLALTFLGSLAFLPAAVLIQRPPWRAAQFSEAPTGQRTALLGVFFMLNPLWVQNTTFAWTKLPAAFFTLAAIHYFLAADHARVRSASVLAAAVLAAALLTHYSAGPYAAVFALAWIYGGRAHYREIAWWRETALAASVGVALLATWFGWSVNKYGGHGTFLTNTSVTDLAPNVSSQLATIALNVRDTLVPHFLRSAAAADIDQTSPWGWWRDWFFFLYQVNLPWAVGSVAWLVLLVILYRRARATAPRVCLGWLGAISGTILLGVAAHGARAPWGLAHICLQPLVLTGLGLLAAEWVILPVRWRRLLIIGALVDGIVGIALSFGIQSFLLDQWLTPGRSLPETMASYTQISQINLNAKRWFKLEFLGDRFSAHETLILAILGALLLLALYRASLPTRTPTAASPVAPATAPAPRNTIA